MHCIPHTMAAKEHISRGKEGKNKQSSLFTEWRTHETRSEILQCEKCIRLYLKPLGCLYCKYQINGFNHDKCQTNQSFL